MQIPSNRLPYCVNLGLAARNIEKFTERFQEWQRKGVPDAHKYHVVKRKGCKSSENLQWLEHWRSWKTPSNAGDLVGELLAKNFIQIYDEAAEHSWMTLSSKKAQLFNLLQSFLLIFKGADISRNGPNGKSTYNMARLQEILSEQGLWWVEDSSEQDAEWKLPKKIQELEPKS